MTGKHDINILDHITAAQREAAELMMQAHGILAECKTGHRDVVTQYDRRIQELLMQRLSRDVPGAHFFCEENGQQDPTDAEHLFIIDPIDGTMNFVRGFGHSCISVAYMSRGELRAASVYNPYLDEQFTALSGEGAWLNGRPWLRRRGHQALAQPRFQKAAVGDGRLLRHVPLQSGACR